MEGAGPRIRGRREGVVGFAIVAALWATWLAGQVFRDRTWLLGLCFDIPSPAVAALCLVAAWRLRRRGWSVLWIAPALFSLAPLGMVVLVENRWIRPAFAPTGEEPVRLIHWNVGYGAWGYGGAKEELLRSRARIYVLSEVPPEFEIHLAAGLGPGYAAIRMGSMAVVADGPLDPPRRLVDDGTLRVHSVTWRGGRGPLELFAVDIASNPRVPRDPLLRRLGALMEEHRPDIVAGDFNSPRRSRALCPLPRGFVHAYDVAGAGWSSTWPLPLPLLAIDQCILSERISAASYDLRSTPYSDHRLQSLEFFADPPRRATATFRPASHPSGKPTTASPHRS